MSKEFLGYDMLIPMNALTHVHLKVDEFKKLVFFAQHGEALNLMGAGWVLRLHAPNLWVASAGQLSFTAKNPIEALQGLTAVVQSFTRGVDDKDNGDKG